MRKTKWVLAVLGLSFCTACEFSAAERQAVLSYYTHSQVQQQAPVAARPAPPPAQIRPLAAHNPPVNAPVAHALPGAPSCAGSSSALCLALKYIVYETPGGDPIETDRDVLDGLHEVNQLWGECGIRFQIDHYQAIKPEREQLRYRTADYAELNQIRRKFMDDKTLLVVMTGTWDRSGPLGNTGANAWTNMPGEPLLGAILEKPVSQDSNVLAHELGHYLSLGHVTDPRGLMHALIYSDSRRLSAEECESARWAARSFWKKMMR